MWKRRMVEVEQTIARLRVERGNLAAQRSEGLSADDVASVQAFAAEVREGFEDFGPADIHRVVELVDLRLTVRDDPTGINLGKPSRRYRNVIGWQGRVQICDSGSKLLNQYLPTYTEWQKFLPGWEPRDLSPASF